MAIKIPRKDQLSEAETEQFLREARAAAQLKHPNIVPTAREAAELCAKISDALHDAHVAGVIHRDLKPGNIMMDMDGEPPRIEFCTE